MEYICLQPYLRTFGFPANKILHNMAASSKFFQTVRLTWVMNSECQRDSAPVAVVEAVAGDGHRAVNGHLVLLTVLRYVE